MGREGVTEQEGERNREKSKQGETYNSEVSGLLRGLREAGNGFTLRLSSPLFLSSSPLCSTAHIRHAAIPFGLARRHLTNDRKKAARVSRAHCLLTTDPPCLCSSPVTWSHSRSPKLRVFVCVCVCVCVCV